MKTSSIVNPQSSIQTTHRCRVAGCAEQVPNHFLLCRHHDKLIPDALRQRMSEAHRENDRRGTVATIQAYAKSVQNAIDAVEARAACSQPGSSRGNEALTNSMKVTH